MFLLKSDIENMKKQIQSWNIRPAQLFLGPDLWKDITTSSLQILYRLILKDGFVVVWQLEQKNGFAFVLECQKGTSRRRHVLIEYN